MLNFRRIGFKLKQKTTTVTAVLAKKPKHPDKNNQNRNSN